MQPSDENRLSADNDKTPSRPKHCAVLNALNTAPASADPRPHNPPNIPKMHKHCRHAALPPSPAALCPRLDICVHNGARGHRNKVLRQVPSTRQTAHASTSRPNCACASASCASTPDCPRRPHHAIQSASTATADDQARWHAPCCTSAAQPAQQQLLAQASLAATGGKTPPDATPRQ
jgi:hypothetical protein